jgi:hypothetical protein
MRKADVQVGGIYRAKVSGRVVDVLLLRECSFGGWYAQNVETRREIRIKSAQRLRERVR